MIQISRTRIVIILLAAVASLLCTLPSARYYLHLLNRPVDMKSVEFAEWDTKADRLRQSAIPLGLDLIGGVDVTLSLDKDKAIQTEVTQLMDSFKEDLNDEKISALFTLSSDKKAFTLELDNAEDARTAAGLLEFYDSRLVEPLTEEGLRSGVPIRVELNTDVLDFELSAQISGAMKGIRERVDALGVTQPRITMQGESQIRVQVPGEKDPDRLIETVIKPAFLEFRLVHKNNVNLIGLDGKLLPGATVPLGAEIVPGKVGRYNSETKQIEFNERDFVVNQQLLTGKYLSNARVTTNMSDFDDPVQVSLEFNREGAAIFSKITKEHKGRIMAILLDGVVRSAAELIVHITDGRAVISGGFNQGTATELSQILKAGSLPAPLKIDSKHTVGATLGAESILAGMRALAWGAVPIMIFMVFYYGMAGVISIVSLVLNVLIILAIMSMARATLTLSGIGGILLTVGMAVDANVLIYEHIREELRGDRPLRQAIKLGFGRAFAVILDSNLTTLLAALVLLQFTEGSVFGFAMTMTFGLLANLFTGLTVTFTLCVLWFNWRGVLSLGKLAFFRNTAFPFIKLRRLSWPFSIVILVASLIGVMATGGLEYGVDFEGGLRSEVQFDKEREVSEDDMRKMLTGAGFKDPRVQVVKDVGMDNTFILDVKKLQIEEGAVEDDDLQLFEVKLREALSTQFADAFEIHYIVSFSKQTSQGFTQLALWVVFLASIAILIYLSMRFEPVFGVAAVIALVHDLLIVILVGTLWDVQITLEVVAALMVLLGFSVNDTIVIFDRIRENTRNLFGKTFEEICNLSMNQSLARTVVTSGTTFIAVGALFLLGGEGLRSFAKVILLGTVFGTYSSCFLAAPLVFQWNAHQGNRLQQTLAAKKKKAETLKQVRSAQKGR
jgi:SecD/SecF fusion protein